MKVYIVTSGHVDSEDYEYCVDDIEAVFTDINQAAMYIISHKNDSHSFELRIEKYEADDVTYLSNKKPKKIALGRYYPMSNILTEKRTDYDYCCCEELIEKEDFFLISTTVPVETSDSEAFDILVYKYKQWAKQQKEE